MSAASDYLENKVLDHTLGNAAFVQPTVYIGLFTGSASANLEAGTLTNEVTGGSYARETISFGVASGGTATNDATVTFTTATADWGTITHVAIMDAASSGNVLFYGAVTDAKEILNGDTFQVSSGNLSITLT